MSTKSHPGPFDCYGRAEPDEPLFTLLARDPLAPRLVLIWAALRELSTDSSDPKVSEARTLVGAMQQWRLRNRTKNATSELGLTVCAELNGTRVAMIEFPEDAELIEDWYD